MVRQGDSTVPLIGSVFAERYRIDAFVGRGAIGTVLKASDLALENETIALKLLDWEAAFVGNTIERFRNELMLARRLGHPHIVRLYDFSRADSNRYFITMEYLDGQNLQQLIAGAALSFPQSIAALYQICVALDYAHSLHIVHRDLKPANIILDRSGTVKLTDFGCARSLDQQKHLTATGDAIGTPAYMSPEQMRGETAAPHMDIYALGIIAYELAAGEKPFTATNLAGLLAQQLNRAVPKLTAIRSDIPQWFQEFVETCTEKKAAYRYASAAEAAEVIAEHIRNDECTELAPVRRFFCPACRNASRERKGSWSLRNLFGPRGRLN